MKPKINAMNIPLLKSLKFRMPLLVLSGVVPLILLAIFYASDRATRTLREEANQNMDLRAKMLADSVSRWDEMNVSALKNLSSLPDIVSMNSERQKAVLVGTIDNYKHLYLAMTTDLEGMNVARSDNSQLTNYRDRSWFLEAVAGKDISYATLIGRTSKKPAVCMSAPIREHRLEILGVASICTDLQDLGRQLGQIRFGKTGYIFMIDSAGHLLAHPNSELISAEQLTDYSDYPAIEQIARTGLESTFFEDDKGVKWFARNVELKNGWDIYLIQQEDDLLSSEKQFQGLAIAISVITVLGVSILVWILANRLIRPIGKLTEAAASISDGKWDTKVEIERQDELGILAHSFNQMATQLNDCFDRLENQIAERTARLEEVKKAKEAAEDAKRVAEAANQAKDRFIANISHELRTPLNSILGYSKLLLRDTRLNITQIQHLKLINQSGNHLLTLINDILDFAKTKAGKMELDLSDLHLSSFLNEVTDIVLLWAQEKNLELKCQIADDLPPLVRADEKRLRQVLLNLLSNAVKFTFNGEVTLKVSLLNSQNLKPNHQTIRFEVRDTGTGINSQQLKRIFQPFEQVGDVRSRAAGTGLGLSISKQLVELMGGKIEVKSELGFGSTFWFDLNLYSQAETSAIEPQEVSHISEVIAYEGRQRKLLVVDDKEENRLLLISILEPLGFSILSATNGQEMMDVVSSFRPDLILLDLFMPVRTGFSSAKHLKQTPEFKNIPIIVVSASSITDDVRSYLECDGYLNKPIDEDELMELLERHLSIEWICKAS